MKLSTKKKEQLGLILLFSFLAYLFLVLFFIGVSSSPIIDNNNSSNNSSNFSTYFLISIL